MLPVSNLPDLYSLVSKKRGNLLHPLHQSVVPRGKRLLRIKTYNWTKNIMGFPVHSIAKENLNKSEKKTTTA